MSYCKWKTASSSDQLLVDVIERLLSKHPKLISYIFHPSEPRLTQSAENLICQSRAFSKGEGILVRIALDFWSRNGSVGLLEIWDLDGENFENTMLALYTFGPRTFWTNAITEALAL